MPNSAKKSMPYNSSDKVVIAVDVMSGSIGVKGNIKAVSAVAKLDSNIEFKLFGKRNLIEEQLFRYKNLRSVVEVIQADDIVKDEDKPTEALRSGRRSSMALAIKSVKAGEADVVVSSGNTGALMTFSKILLRTLPGIDRPAIGAILPTEKGSCVCLDMGANIHCDAENLYEFCVMGSAFAKALLDKKNPTIGLLNIGEEKHKGHEVLRSAASLVEENSANLNYFGFVEGNDINKGTTDVVVTDGFNGNVALKAIEGAGNFCAKMIKQSLLVNPLSIIALPFILPSLYILKRRIDPSNYNGAMFLGLNGIVVKSHGGTSVNGFKNAIINAAKLARFDINKNITNEMLASGHIPLDDETSLARDFLEDINRVS